MVFLVKERLSFTGRSGYLALSGTWQVVKKFWFSLSLPSDCEPEKMQLKGWDNDPFWSHIIHPWDLKKGRPQWKCGFNFARSPEAQEVAGEPWGLGEALATLSLFSHRSGSSLSKQSLAETFGITVFLSSLDRPQMPNLTKYPTWCSKGKAYVILEYTLQCIFNLCCF